MSTINPCWLFHRNWGTPFQSENQRGMKVKFWSVFSPFSFSYMLRVDMNFFVCFGEYYHPLLTFPWKLGPPVYGKCYMDPPNFLSLLIDGDAVNGLYNPNRRLWLGLFLQLISCWQYLRNFSKNHRKSAQSFNGIGSTKYFLTYSSKLFKKFLLTVFLKITLQMLFEKKFTYLKKG